MSDHPNDKTYPSLADNSPEKLKLRCAIDIRPEPIRWLWPGWLAAGKMHIFGGAPGTGKTTIAMALAATVTTGGRWPDGTRCQKGSVVIWSGEDDPADTLVPRLALSGADLSCIHFVGDVNDQYGRRAFDPATDIELLRLELDGIDNVRLLIVDPVVSAVTGDSHKNAEVRRGLQPLADVAASLGCALVGITHFTKGTGGREPVERITGSLAFGALARVVLVAAKHQTDNDDGVTARLFCRAKSNIGPDDGGYEYDIHQAALETNSEVFSSYAVWGRRIDGTARELLAVADSVEKEESGALGDAKAFLIDLLKDGPVPSRQVWAEAKQAAHSEATIRRAKDALRIAPQKRGGHFGDDKQKWVWCLPPEDAPEDVHTKTMSVFSKNEHLQAQNPQSSAKSAEDVQDAQDFSVGDVGHLQASDAKELF